MSRSINWVNIDFNARKWLIKSNEIIQILRYISARKINKKNKPQATGPSIKPMCQKLADKQWGENFTPKAIERENVLTARGERERKGNIELRDSGKNNFILLGAVWNLWLKDFNKNILMFILSADKRLSLEKGHKFLWILCSVLNLIFFPFFCEWEKLFILNAVQK